MTLLPPDHSDKTQYEFPNDVIYGISDFFLEMRGFARKLGCKMKARLPLLLLLIVVACTHPTKKTVGATETKDEVLSEDTMTVLPACFIKDSTDTQSADAEEATDEQKTEEERLMRIAGGEDAFLTETIGTVKDVTYFCVYEHFYEERCDIVGVHSSGRITRRCKVLGPSCLSEVQNGHQIRLFYGLESRTFDLETLPATVNMNIWMDLDGFQRYERKRDFVISKAFIGMTLRPSQQEWMSKQLADFIYAEELLDNEELFRTEPLKKPHVASYASLMTYYLDAKIGREAPDYNPEEEHSSPNHDLRNIVPTWQSADSIFTTYRVNDFAYYGGAHPYYQIFYLTFDIEKQRLLGMHDIFRKGSTAEIIRRLKLKAGDHGIYCNEAIDEQLETEPRHEKYQTHLIPRPALTRKGVVFSYQPYEIGCFADGDFHFVLPYKEIRDLLNPDILDAVN